MMFYLCELACFVLMYLALLGLHITYKESFAEIKSDHQKDIATTKSSIESIQKSINSQKKTISKKYHQQTTKEKKDVDIRYNGFMKQLQQDEKFNSFYKSKLVEKKTELVKEIINKSLGIQEEEVVKKGNTGEDKVPKKEKKVKKEIIAEEENK